MSTTLKQDTHNYRDKTRSRGNLPRPKNYNPPSQEMLDLPVVEYFELHADRFSDKSAIRLGNTEYTFHDLNILANRVAHTLLRNKTKTKGATPLLFGKNPKMAGVIIGTLKSANFFVPLDPSYPFERLQFMLQDSESERIVTDSKNLALAERLGKKKYNIINIDELNSNTEDENPKLNISPDTLSHILYTSGTTGTPKGIVFNHGKLHSSLVRFTTEDYYWHEDRVSMLGSFGFGGSLHMVLYILMNGASLHLYNLREEGFNPLAGWLQSEKITIYNSTPTVFRHFCKNLSKDDIFPHIRMVRLSGEAILKHDAELYKMHFPQHSRMRLALASTEVGAIARDYIGSESEISEDVVPPGYIAKNVTVFLWDKEGKEVQLGDIGEIVVKTPTLASGYWRRPDLTKSKFLPDPYGSDMQLFMTGDLGKFLPDGRLVHMGRKDGMVKVRGFRVEIGAIENALLEHKMVDDAVVKIIDNQVGNKQIIAYIVPVDKADLLTSDVRIALAEKLPNYMLPARIVVMEKFPSTATGKVDRNSLPLPDRSRPLPSNEYVAPKDKIEDDLVKVWEAILDLEQVGVYDNFFDLGGDSLLAAQLFVEIEKVFNKKLPLSILYTASNISEQADILRQKDLVIDWSPLVGVQPKGTKPPLFCFPGKGGNPIRFRHLSQRLGEDQPVYMLQSRGLSGKVAPFERLEDIATDFLNAIQEVDSDGPYSLVGSSGGGHVAYEIAQQLLAQGRQVSLLAFVDTYGPGYPKYLLTNTSTKKRLYRIMQYIGKHISNLRVASWTGRKEYVSHYINESWRRIKKATRNDPGKLKESTQSFLPQELVDVQKANLKAMRNYKPQSYPGTVILFRARQQPWGIHPDPTLGWGDVGIAELDIHEMPGHHGSILFEPRVGKLANILGRLLAKQER